MEEQFILRVPPSVSKRIERLLNNPASSSEDKLLDLSFSEDGRAGTFIIGNDQFSASLMDLPTVVESYKTYDDNVLIKTADVRRMIKIADEGESIPETTECRHGLTLPMRDARRQRFRREPDLNPEVVRRVGKDLQNIVAGGTAEHIGVEMAEAEEDVNENARSDAGKKVIAEPSTKPDVPESETVEAEESDSEESDDSL